MTTSPLPVNIVTFFVDLGQRPGGPGILPGPGLDQIRGGRKQRRSVGGRCDPDDMFEILGRAIEILAKETGEA